MLLGAELFLAREEQIMFVEANEEITLDGQEQAPGPRDVRYRLWQQFCADNNVSVESLPSELETEVRLLWQRLKEESLGF